MTEKRAGNHIKGEQQMLDYFEGRLPEQEARALEEHIADCRRCTEMARSILALQNTWEEWTPRSYGESVLRERLYKGLDAVLADPRHQVRAERIRSWRERLPGWLENAQVVTADFAESYLMLELMETTSDSGSVGEPPEGVTNARDTMRSGDRERGSLTLTGSRPLGWLHASTPGSRVSVGVEWMGETGDVPLVLLVPDHAPDRSRLAGAERVDPSDPDRARRVADFDLDTPGTFLVVLEPSRGLAV